MRILLALTLAVALAAALNHWIPRVLGLPGLRYLVPLGEEVAKTIPAVLLGAPVLSVHVAFGLVEAVYEAALKPSTGVPAGAVAVVVHAVFGGIAALTLRRTGNVLLALALSSLVHTAWNRLAAKLARGRSSPQNS